jgi:GNAT superfamily N-acetyltransferase
MLRYSTSDAISVADFRDVLERSTLARRRPVDDEPCLQGMLEHADLTVTAWDEGLLVGVARSVTDFSYCCYLSDLAVDFAYQRRGIGRRLIEETRSALGPRCTLILLSAPAAVDYYPRIGFERHPQAWVLAPGKALLPEGGEGGGG